MLEVEFSYWALAIAVLFNCVLGALWYSPVAFGKTWKRLTGVDIMKMPTNEANRAIGFVTFAAVIQTFVLGVIVKSLGANTFFEGLLSGFVLWLGFIAATTIGTTFYQKRSWNFWWLNSSYFLIVMLVNSVIFAVWQ